MCKRVYVVCVSCYYGENKSMSATHECAVCGCTHVEIYASEHEFEKQRDREDASK